MKVFMTEPREQREWVKEFDSSVFGSEECHFWGKITEEDTKYYWLMASKQMGYNITFLDDKENVCIQVPTSDITSIKY